jgi:hypothetical protein
VRSQLGVWRVVATAGLALGLCACDLEPCGNLELGAPIEPTPEHGAVIAVGDQGQIEVLRSCAGDTQCESQPQPVILSETEPPDQVMLTGSGRWLVYRMGSDVGRVDLDACADDDVCTSTASGFGGIDEIVGSLRGGDWIIYRSWGEGSSARSELWAIYVGDEQLLDNDAGETRFRLGAGMELRTVAMGHRHVVARRSLGDGSEELYLIRVTPARYVDRVDHGERGEARLLASGDSFQRVVITEGPSPADRGDPFEFQHEVPTDAQIIATSGRGGSARTLIYSVANLGQIANFAGEVVTKHAALEDVPGLSPVSPDGSRLAYITPGGSLALRSLEDQSSCMVRSATSATHLLAGFAADGTLYFEAEEERPSKDLNESTQVVELVHAYDPATQLFTQLTEDLGVWRLKAVPPSYEDHPWAIVGAQGDYLVEPGELRVSLNYDDARYLPRSDSLWVIEAESETYEPSLRVHELQPNSDTGPERALFERSYEAVSTVCFSASQSASRTTPWASHCSAPTDPETWLSADTPEAEQSI